jgi:hypothetical protein
LFLKDPEFLRNCKNKGIFLLFKFLQKNYNLSGRFLTSVPSPSEYMIQHIT